jgi:glycosyltransferase involved in cell wall biosynthesis
MKLVQITPGAGGMYCGNCLRDNALVAELRRLGHDVIMLPLYLPLTLDEADQSAGMPVFFGGVNVYLDQVFPLFRKAPHWLRNCLSSPRMLRWAGRRAAKTRAEDVGELALSMLRGEEGNQQRDLEELLDWLKSHGSPDVVILSNALLLGLVRRLKSELRAQVVCLLSGEDDFLDHLIPNCRSDAWRIASERAQEADGFIAPSRYFADLMARRLSLAPHKLKVVHSGISLAGYESTRAPRHSFSTSPVIGYLARMCPEKGLDLLIDAFIQLRQRGQAGPVRLRVAGGCGPGDESFVREQRRRLELSGLAGEVEFFPNLERHAKIEFLSSLDIFSVPARYSEAYGLYLIEAMAAGVAVVQPAVAAFPEVVAETGGGMTYERNNAEALARAWEDLLSDPGRLATLGTKGREAVFNHYSARVMAEKTVATIRDWSTTEPRRTVTAHA